MARQNGGLIGKRNVTSFGKCTTTVKTSSGNLCLQSGTRAISATIVAGGGAGGGSAGSCTASGGGGAGGLRNVELNANGQIPITIGAGGSGETAFTYLIIWNETKYQADNTKGWAATKSNDTAETPTVYDWNGSAWVSE